MTCENLIEAMKNAGSAEKKAVLQRFFKTGPGGYAEGDIFLGIMNPATRRFASEYRDLPLADCRKLLRSPYHEIRLCSLLILVRQFKKADVVQRKKILALYVKAASENRINNWDLVDLSAPGITGLDALENGPELLRTLLRKDSLWEKRIAMVSTWTLIRAGQLDLTFEFAEALMDHPHDLIHKACGWMLRDTGKHDRTRLTAFLLEHRPHMPRTMLRYAIEHYPESERKSLMAKE